MEEYIPDIIEPIPIIKKGKCKFVMYVIYLFISFFPTIAGFIIWYMYGFFIGVAFFLFLTLVMGIVISKMRLMSIPVSQREVSYSNLEVTKWFTDKNLCV
ncbi:MAG: hypothetical protein R3331_03645 [Sulfurospirillaceae bacterium]|nr:hypothetical protein [Sulfurospirillaceae bacterium]